MTKPDDIPQGVWDKATSTALEFTGWGDIYMYDIIPPIARAIMAAKAEEREAIARDRSQAYEDCAKIAEEYKHKESGFRSVEPDKTVYGWGAARREIAAAIRKRGETD